MYCADDIFSPFIDMLGHQAEITSTHSECKQHMEIVHISAKGSETSFDRTSLYEPNMICSSYQQL